MKYCFAVVFLFLFKFYSVAQTPTVIRGPYLQVVTPTSVVVRWRTDQPTTGRVWFGLQANQLTNSQQETQPTQDHIVKISGLQPATRYSYAVGYSDTQLAFGADYYVKTALPAGDTRPFRFWILGDFGIGSENQFNVYKAYQRVTANHPADLWLWLGDNAYCCGQEEEYQRLVFSVYPPSLRNTPIFTTPGNHDYADSHTNFNIPYYNLFSFPEQGESGGVPSGSKSYFSANYGNVHFVSLDSQAQFDGQFRLYDTTSTQVQWLKRDLTANKLPWTVVIFHHPPYSKGGHNSDLEEQLRLIRENLTPILERYGVDLVVNGHSHSYERFYRLKNLRGMANTFNKTVNVAENTTAKYDGSPNSCPILTKGIGTVYVVNGSGGALGRHSPDWPHPGTVYADTTIGGSMVLDVNDNRLDAQLIMADGSIRDRFTMMKNVNKMASLTAEYADTLQLTASWPGDYAWQTGQTTRSIRYPATRSGTYTVGVTDARQCLTDQFTLTIAAPPRITAKTSVSVCSGGSVAVTATPENTTKAAGWQYDVLLSDASGNFANERAVGSGALTALKATLPANLPTGAGYRLRVRPRGISYAELVPSDAFVIKPAPTATLAGSGTVLQGTPASLTLTFTGDGPWQGTLSDGTLFSTASSPFALTVQPAQTTTYTVKTLTNVCGNGTATGQAIITVMIPTEAEAFADGILRIYPNPAHEVIHVELSVNQKKDVRVLLRDVQGKSVFQKQFGQVSAVSESIPMPAPTGVYLLTVQAGDQTLTRKVIRQ
jgi:hypothetical protein